MNRLAMWLLFFMIALSVIFTCVLLWGPASDAATTPCTYPAVSCSAPALRATPVTTIPTTTVVVHPAVGDALPFTGADIGEMSVVGAAALGLGMTVLIINRRKVKDAH